MTKQEKQKNYATELNAMKVKMRKLAHAMGKTIQRMQNLSSDSTESWAEDEGLSIVQEMVRELQSTTEANIEGALIDLVMTGIGDDMILAYADTIQRSDKQCATPNLVTSFEEATVLIDK